MPFQAQKTHEGTGKDEFGGADLRDVLQLLDFIDQCAFADRDRIVMMGESRGSIMTFEVLRMDPRVKASIVTGSVPDLEAVYNLREHEVKSMLKYRVGGSPEEVPAEYEKRSALLWADEIDVPLLVFHTEDDARAPIAPVDAFVALLQEQGKDVRYIRQAEGGHCWKDWGIILEFFPGAHAIILCSFVAGQVLPAAKSNSLTPSISIKTSKIFGLPAPLCIINTDGSIPPLRKLER